MRHKNEKSRFALAVIMSVLTFMSPTFAYANPSGGQVVGGNATIAQGDLSTIIRQLSDKAIINWQDFSIGANESVQFIQPGAGSIVLNRVTGQELSTILGELRANGNVFLVNPNGILFGAGSTVDVAGLMASTFGISDADFLSGKYNFAQNASSLASVVNQGRITVGDKGFVYLVAPGVNNSGLIVAKAGQVALASGTGFTLDFTGEGLIKFNVSGQVAETVKGSDGRPLTTAVSNTGVISNAGGRVILTGDAARSVMTSVVSNTGLIEATSLAGIAGQVDLIARSNGDVINSGNINVSSAAGSAGRVLLSGGNVAQLGTVSADALGNGNAGSIDVRASEVVAIGADSVTTANAGQNGNGGSIIVIGEKTALVATGATLAARGGSQSGDGGFIETSGFQNLSIGTFGDVSAANGAAGTWLIDPNNITIVAGTGNTGVNNSNPFASTLSGAQLGVDLITAALAGGNVYITTGTGGSEAGNITLSTALTYTGGMGRTLTLNAHNDIILNAAIASTNAALNLMLIANYDVGDFTASGTGAVFASSTINTNGGSVTTAGVNFTSSTAGAITTGGGLVDIQNTGAVSIAGTINTSGGSIVIEDAASIAVTSSVTTSGNAWLFARNGDIVTTGSGQINAGALTLVTHKLGANIGGANNALKVNAGTLNAWANFGNIVVTDTAGGIALGTVNTGGDKGETDATRAIITANAGAITQASGTGINAWSANLVANGTPVGSPDWSIGTSGNAIKTAVTVLSASTEDGSIHVNQTGQVILNNISAKANGLTPYSNGSGNVVIDASDATSNNSISITGNDDIFVAGTLVSPGAITVASTGGSLIDTVSADGVDGLNFVTRTLTLNAANSVGLAGDAFETSVNTLNASAGRGGVYIAENNHLAIGTVSAATNDYAAIANDVVISATGGNVQVGEITATGAVVKLSAAAGSLTDGNGATGNVTAAKAILVGKQGIGTAADRIETNVSALEVTSDTLGRGIYITEASGLDSLRVETLKSDVAIGFGAGALNFNATSGALAQSGGSIAQLGFNNTGGNIALGGLDTGATGTLSVQALTSITQNSGVIIADTATLAAGTNIGASGAAIATNVNTLSLAADNGAIHVAEQSGALKVTAQAKGTASGVAVSTVGDLLVNTVSAPGTAGITLTSSTGSILNDAGSTAINLSGSSATLTASSGSIGTSSAALRSTVAGAYSATAGNGGVNAVNIGDISLLSASATGGGVTLNNSGAVALGTVSATGQAVNLSASGNITDGNGATGNITSSTLTLTGRSIGTAADSVEIDTGSLTASTTAGDLYLAQVGTGDLDLVSAKAAGDLGISAAGNILLGVVSAPGKNVKLAATGTIEDNRANNESRPNVQSKSLDISGSGIGALGALAFDVNFLSASGGSGGVSASNLGSVFVDSSSLVGKGGSTVSISGASITILDDASNLIQLDNNGSLVLIAESGNIVFLDTNDTIAVSGSGTITLKALYVGSGPNLGKSGVIIAGNLRTAGGAISLEAESHISIGLLDAGYGQGAVTVRSNNGLIIDNNGAAGNIIGGTVNLSAKTPTQYIAELIREAAGSTAASNAGVVTSTTTQVNTLTSEKESLTVMVNGAGITDALARSALAIAEHNDRVASNDLENKENVFNGLVIAFQVANTASSIAQFIAGAAQAVPFSGDAGADAVFAGISAVLSAADLAMTIYENTALKAASDLADTRAAELATAEQLAANSSDYLNLTTDLLNSKVAALNIADVALYTAKINKAASDQVLVQALKADAAGNLIGTSSQALGVQATQLNIQTVGQAGTAVTTDVYLESAGNLGLGDIQAVGTTSKIVATANNNIAVLGTVESPTSIALTATNGAIIGTSAGKLVADSVVLKAATGIGDLTANAPVGALTAFNLVNSTAVNTQTDLVAASGGSGGARVHNANGTAVLTVGEIGSVTGVSAAGDISIVTGGDLKLSKAVTDTNTTNPASTVTLTATAGDILDDNGASTNVTGGTLVATASGNITLDTAVDTANASSTVSGDITLRETNGVTLANISAVDGNVSVVAAAGDITVQTITANAADANITLTATGGAINDDANNATKITGQNLILSSANGIGTSGSAATRSLDTVVNNLTATVTTAGAINLTDDNDLNVVSAVTANGDVTLQSTTGSLNVTTITANGTGNTVTLVAGNAITDAANNDATNITAANVALTAGTGIGSATNALETTIDKLEATSTTGGIYVTDLAGDLTIGGVTPGLSLPALSGLQATTSGDIVVKAANSLVINETIATADGNVNLTATTGSITGATVITHVSAQDFNATAATGIGSSTTPLKTAIDTLTASVTGTGDIHINEANSIELTDVKTADGSITLTAATGDIRVVSVDAGTTTGDVTLTATAGAINDDNDNATKITANALTLTADTGLGVTGASDATRSLDTAANSLTASVTTAGVINIAEDDDLNVLNVVTPNGDVTIQSAAGSLNVTTIAANGVGNTVTLAAAAAITDANDAATPDAPGVNNITATHLALSAGTGIGTATNVLETTVTHLEAVSTTGGIYVTDLAGDLTIGGVNPGLSLPATTGLEATTSGDIVVKAANAIIINERILATDGDVNLTATTGSITGANAITHVTSNDLTATAATGINLVTTVATATLDVTSSGNINIVETDAIELTDVKTANGSITVTAGGTIDAVKVVSTTDADANDISLTATNGGSIVIDTVNAGTTAGDVILTANTGEGTVKTNADGRVTADNLRVTAASGIDLTTTVNTTTLEVTTAGSIKIDELNAVTLTDVKTANGAITVAAGGTINAVSVVSTTDADANDIALTATGGGSILIDTVNAGTTAGDVTLTANTGSGEIKTNASGLVTGDVLTATAASGINLVTTINAADLEVTGTGDVKIVETNGLELTSVKTNDGAITVDSTTGDIRVVSIAAGGVTGDIALTATTGAINDDNDNSTKITGNALTLTAANGIGANGAAATRAIDTAVSSLTASVTTAGAINIAEDDDLAVDSVTTLDGNVTVTSTTGSLAVKTIAANGVGNTVTLAAGAAITDAKNDGDANVTATNLAITAGTGIGTSTTSLKTDIANLEAKTTTGGIYVTDLAGDLTLGGVTPNLDLAALSGVKATTSGDIVINAVDSLIINEGVSTANGNVKLTATNGSISGATEITHVSGKVFTATSATGIDLVTAIDSAKLEVTDAGSIKITELNAVELTDVKTAEGAITVTAGGTLTAKSVVSTTDAAANSISLTTTAGDIVVDRVAAGAGVDGNVSLTAAGAINQLAPSDLAIDVVANALTLQAGTGIGIGAGGPLDLAVNSLAATSTTGNINVIDQDDLIVKAVEATAGNVSIKAGGVIADDNDNTTKIVAQALTLTAENGIGTSGAAGTRAIDTSVDSVNASTTTGNINIDEANGIRVTATTPAGDVTINAAAGNLDVDTITATGTGSTVKLVAAAGTIRDANANNANNITAANLALTASAGVGQSSNALDVTTQSLTASGGTGGVYVNNLSAGLTLAGVDATGGNIVIKTPGTLTVASPITNSGNGDIDLTTTDTGTDGDVILVNAALSALGGGSIRLNADDSIAQNADITVNGKGNVNITAGDDIVMADDVTTTAGNGTVSYNAGGDLAVNKIETDPNRVSGGTVSLTGNTITTNHPDEVAVTGAFLNVNTPKADTELVRDLIGESTDSTGIRINDRLVGGEIAYDSSFYGSLMIRTEREFT
ncbi:MAG: filamentous hemagglutinin N-terminal domain-containing protein, partial [Rariglobus sp.]